MTTDLEESWREMDARVCILQPFSVSECTNPVYQSEISKKKSPRLCK